jgi:hypothetical protein
MSVSEKPHCSPTKKVHVDATITHLGKNGVLF